MAAADSAMYDRGSSLLSRGLFIPLSNYSEDLLIPFTCFDRIINKDI